MKEFENIVSTGYTILVISIAVLVILRFLYYRRTKQTRINISQEKSIFRIFRYLFILGFPVFAIGLTNYIFILQRGSLFAPYWAKVGLLLALFILVCTELGYHLHLKPGKINRIFNILFATLFLFLGILLNKLYIDASRHPDIASSVIIDLPFRGKWVASGAGASGLTNHHDRIQSQKYAIDIVKFGDNGKLFKKEGVANEDSYTFGAEIISPVNGVVVHLIDSLPDRKITDRDKLAGNHIIIEFQDSLFIALAHLKQHSISVKLGDTVEIGEKLAQVGNSGNTDFPHLHVHIQNSETYDIDTTTTYPIRFREFRRMRYGFWTNQKNQFLLSNDIIKPR